MEKTFENQSKEQFIEKLNKLISSGSCVFKNINTNPWGTIEVEIVRKNKTIQLFFSERNERITIFTFENYYE